MEHDISELQQLAWCIKATVSKLPQTLQWDNDDYASLHAIQVLVEAEACMVRRLKQNVAEQYLLTKGPSTQET